MTKLLRDMLRPDYLRIIKARMLQRHYNNTALARETGYSRAHIGNILKGQGSDDGLAAICRVLGIEILSLLKEGPGAHGEEHPKAANS